MKIMSEESQEFDTELMNEVWERKMEKRFHDD